MRAMVLAAGLGTRLRPLTLERPKPGVPYGDRPLACLALDCLAGVGVRQALINTHHLGEMLPALLESYLPEGMSVTYIHEPVLLGTGGGIRNARAHLSDGEPVLVLNSDIVFRPDLEAALALHRSLGAVATMVLRPDPDAERFGPVEVDEGGRVRRLLGAPDYAGALNTFMFTGVHVLSPRAFDDLPESGCIVRHAYRRWVDEGEVVAGFVDRSVWADLGTLRRYLDAHLELAADGNVIHPNAVVDPRAMISRSVIGTGAHVGPVRVERSVVWPDASLDRDVDSCIVTPKTIVQVD